MYNNTGSPHVSKKKLFFSWGKFLTVMINHATQDPLKFSDPSLKREIVDHYKDTWKNLAPLGQSLKKAARTEKIRKDELVAEERRQHRLRYLHVMVISIQINAMISYLGFLRV